MEPTIEDLGKKADKELYWRVYQMFLYRLLRLFRSSVLPEVIKLNLHVVWCVKISKNTYDVARTTDRPASRKLYYPVRNQTLNLQFGCKRPTIALQRDRYITLMPRMACLTMLSKYSKTKYRPIFKFVKKHPIQSMLSFFPTLVLAPALDYFGDQCGERDTFARFKIFGGRQVESHSWPWMVRISHLKGRI